MTTVTAVAQNGCAPRALDFGDPYDADDTVDFLACRDGQEGQKTQGHTGFSTREDPDGRKQSRHLENPVPQKIPAVQQADETAAPTHLADLERLAAGEITRSQLQHRHASTYSSWKNRKAKASPGGHWHDAFNDFREFLRIVGPRPTPAHTLDRIDNTDPEYATGKVAWRDKTEQANNRSTTIYLTRSADGVCLPLTQWATMTGQKPDTLRDRRDNGWTHDELIAGQRKATAAAAGVWPSATASFPGPEWWEAQWQSLRDPDEDRSTWFVRRVDGDLRFNQRRMSEIVRDLSYLEAIARTGCPPHSASWREPKRFGPIIAVAQNGWRNLRPDDEIALKREREQRKAWERLIVPHFLRAREAVRRTGGVRCG